MTDIGQCGRPPHWRGLINGLTVHARRTRGGACKTRRGVTQGTARRTGLEGQRAFREDGMNSGIPDAPGKRHG